MEKTIIKSCMCGSNDQEIKKIVRSIKDPSLVYYIYCNSCNRLGKSDSSKEKAIEKWNEFELNFFSQR